MFRVLTCVPLSLARRLMQRLCVWLVCAFLFVPMAQAADAIDVSRARLENTDDGYKLSASYAFDLNDSLATALRDGIPLRFTTEVDIARPRWYWLDENVGSATRTVQLSHNNVTGQYRVSVVGEVPFATDSLERALDFLRHPIRWVVADKSSLKTGINYKVTVRIHLDVDQLSAPVQIQLIPGSPLRLRSDPKIFSYKVE